MKTIVAVDDDVASLDILNEMLSEKAVELRSFESSSEAMAFVRSTSDPIDLFLIDVKLHENNGLSMLKELKESGKEYSKSPVVMVSAIATSFYKDKAIALGAADCFMKPFEDLDLLKLIEDI